jgi:hypothetical protein
MIISELEKGGIHAKVEKRAFKTLEDKTMS